MITGISSNESALGKAIETRFPTYDVHDDNKYRSTVASLFSNDVNAFIESYRSEVFAILPPTTFIESRLRALTITKTAQTIIL